MTMVLFQKYQAIAAPLVIMTSTVGILALQLPRLDIDPKSLDADIAAQQEQQEKLRLNLRRQMPSFGFDNLLGDWAFLDFLQYFGDGTARDLTGYTLVPEYFSTVVERNPRFAQAYPFLSPANSLFAGEPELTVQLLTQGLQTIDPKIYPEVYYLWIAKAIDELLFLDNADAARHSYAMASTLAKHSDVPGSQAIAMRTQETAEFLTRNPSSREAQVGSWFMILSNAPDESTRQRAIQKIREMGGDITITPNGHIQVKLPED